MSYSNLRLFTRILGLLLLCKIEFTFGVPPLREFKPEFGEKGQEILVRDRLPVSLIPSLYRLEIQPILTEGFGTRFTAPGKIWITGLASAPVSAITLNSVDIRITSTTVTVTEEGTNAQVGILNTVFETEKEFLRIGLARSLTVNRNYTVYIEFVSLVNTNLDSGLYLSTYVDDNGATKYVASTDFEAPDARRAFPIFDEPHLKAAWEVSIIRLPPYHSIANMDLVRTETDLPGLPNWVKDVYSRSVPMSSYLICLVISEFTSETANSTLYNRPVKVWGPPHLMNRGNGKFSPDFSAKLMKFFEEYYGIEYSLPKMDKVSIPDYSSGAMENWGINTYRETRLLYEEGVSTIQDLVSMTNTISHELVHQWYGNLITCQWWEDLWIQEGAATYFAPIGVAGIGMGDMLPIETLITATVQRSFEFDASDATHPIHNVGVDPAEVPVLFDTLTYHKGASLIRMMSSFLTDAVYRDASTQFLKKFSYKSVHQDDFFAVLDEVAVVYPIGLLPAGRNVSLIMNGWTTQAGFPLVTVERNSLTNLVTFSQAKYFTRVEDATDVTTKWDVPISIFHSSDSRVETRPELWILSSQTSASKQIRDDWFIVNPQTSGYYRVLYKNGLLDRIIEQLFVNHTAYDSQTRSALLDDNLNLAFGGYIELVKGLNLTMYLKNERELFPWVTFVTNMAAPYRMFSRSSGFLYFKKYVLGLMKEALTEINIEPQPNESVPTILLRTRFVEWTCNLGDSECITFARSKFSAWMANPTNTSLVFPDLQPTVYCAAVANGGDAEWEFVYQQYQSADRDVAQTNLLRALGCSKTSFRLNNLLEMALDRNSGIRDKHRTAAMQAVAGNSAGVDLTFNFIRNNYDTIVRRCGTGVVPSVITTLTNSYNNDLDRKDLLTFMESKPDLVGRTAAPLANIDRNIDWISKHYTNFRNFVQALP